MITVYQYLHPFHVGDCSSLSCWRCMPLSCGLLCAMKCKKKWCMSLPVALPYFFFCLTRDYYWYSKKWFLFLKVPAQRWWQHEGESLLSQSVMSSSTGEKQTFAFLCHWKLGVACYHSAWKGVCVCVSVCVCVCAVPSVMVTVATPWTVAQQAPLSMGFSRQEYWGGLPCPPPFFPTQGSSLYLLQLLHCRRIF